jgi:hypothetical protein
MAALRNVVLRLLRQAGAADIAAALRRYSYKSMEALTLLGVSLPGEPKNPEAWGERVESIHFMWKETCQKLNL